MSSLGIPTMFQDGSFVNGAANGAANASVMMAPVSGTVLVRFSVEPRSLEDVLDTLAGLDFAVNPNILHHAAIVSVEFPSSLCDVNKIEEALAMFGPSVGPLEVLSF